jgi:hypothetical protein
MGRETIGGVMPEIYSCIFAYDGGKIDSFKKIFNSFYKNEDTKLKIDTMCVLNKYTAMKESSALASPAREIFFLETGNDSLMIFLTKLLTGMYEDMDSLHRFAGLGYAQEFHDKNKRK